jgi:ribosomal protein S18 acetylase RimI-like enzyme
LQPTAQLALSDLNLVECTREFARRTPGGVIHEEDGMLLFGGVNAASSGVMRTGAQAGRGAETTIAMAETFFRGRETSYAVVTRPDRDADLERAAEAAGFALVRDQPGMVLLHPVPAARLPQDAELRRVDDETGTRAFARLLAEVFVGWEEAVGPIFEGVHGLLQTPRAAGYLVWCGGEAAAAAMVFVTGCGAGVDWVATGVRHRGRGFGEAVTRAASNAGFELGARLVALQANPLAERMYSRAGYTTITRYRWYERPAVGHEDR